MTLSKQLSKSLTPLFSVAVSLALFNTPVIADNIGKTYAPKVRNYTTIMGYNDTTRAKSQVVMAGISPSVINESDTSFDILALVRPGTVPLQKVALAYGLTANPFIDRPLTHINTLKNGDQLWKATYNFDAGTFNNFPKGVFPLKWGNTGADQLSIRTTDGASGSGGAAGNPFPQIAIGSFPSQTAVIDTTKDDILSYKKTRRVVPQIIMAGVSPAVVDLSDTAIDIVAILRPGLVPVQEVILKQENNAVFSYALQKKKVLNNGDEIWVTSVDFPAGSFGPSTFPVVWGTAPGEYNIQVVDIAQQSATAYPLLRSGAFPAQP
jgi:hypothetical protein